MGVETDFLIYSKNTPEIEMQCNCLTKVAENLAEYLKPQAGDDAKAQVSGLAWNLSDGCDEVLNIPFKVTGSKKGYSSAKGKEITVTASFCPFCGISAKKAPSEKLA
jgi:hypothetical protein